MPFFPCKEGQIYYEESGEGPPLLLLRGLGRSSRYWLGFEKFLEDRFRVILMDQRGLGKSTAPASWKGTLLDNALDILSLMDHKGIDRFHVFGLSLGGMIALELGFLAPERLLSMTAANSSSQETGLWRLNPLRFASLLMAGFSGRLHKRLLQDLVGPQVLLKDREAIAAAWKAIRDEEGFPLATIAKQALMAHRFQIGSRRLPARLPVMILVGGSDRFVPPSNSRCLHRLLPGSTCKELPSAGHEITIQHEKIVAELISQISQNVDFRKECM